MKQAIRNEFPGRRLQKKWLLDCFGEIVNNVARVIALRFAFYLLRLSEKRRLNESLQLIFARLIDPHSFFLLLLKCEVIRSTLITVCVFNRKVKANNFRHLEQGKLLLRPRFCDFQFMPVTRTHYFWRSFDGTLPRKCFCTNFGLLRQELVLNGFTSIFMLCYVFNGLQILSRFILRIRFSIKIKQIVPSLQVIFIWPCLKFPVIS